MQTYTGKEFQEYSMKLDKLKYLVVGTGRCGTVYMAKLLTSVGFPCTHEAVFSYDGLNAAIKRINDGRLTMSLAGRLASIVDENKKIRWFKNEEEMSRIVADSSYMAAPYLNHELLKDVSIIHVVRNPADVINSFVYGFHYFFDKVNDEQMPYHKFIYSIMPQLRESMHPLSKAALYYIEWNKMIENLSKGKRYFKHRIENRLDKLFGFMGVKPNGYYNNTRINQSYDIDRGYRVLENIPDKAIADKLNDAYLGYYGVKI